MTAHIQNGEHIEESLLLAYLRRQELEEEVRERIARHLEVEQCPRCRRRLSELARMSSTLEGLGPLLTSEPYPELSVAQTYAHVLSTVNRGRTLPAPFHRANNRQHARTSGIGWMGLSVAFALVILVTVSLLVFANIPTRPGLPGSPGPKKHGPGISTTVLPPHSTSTTKLTPTTPARIGASATPRPPTSTARPGQTPTTTTIPGQSPTPTTLPGQTPTATPTPVGCTTNATITSNFNGTPLAAGSYVWFTSVLKVQGLPASPTWLGLQNQQISFSANSQQYSLAVPDAQVEFDPAASSAQVWFSSQGAWQTTSPSQVSGNIFVSALLYQVPAGGLPGGINPVTWSGQFVFAPNTSLTVQWQWAAAVYTSFSPDYTQEQVKPVDDNQVGPYYNSDPAGTPENYKTDVIGGARGGGGANYTGGLSGTVSAHC